MEARFLQDPQPDADEFKNRSGSRVIVLGISDEISVDEIRSLSSYPHIEGETSCFQQFNFLNE